MSRVTDQQVRKLREEMAKHGCVGKASMKSGMHRNTGRKYIATDKFPSERVQPRHWRTRPDPFEADWGDIEKRLADAPELEARTLFEDLCQRRPDIYQEGQLRTFQRRVKDWRAHHGPAKEVFFPQEHRPGEAIQTDFTWATDLNVTIQGEPFAHMLCHAVLPYSNWEMVTVCQSESMLALRRGIPAALVALGRVPKFHQTDNSTSATHRLATTEETTADVSSDAAIPAKRGFNEEYLQMMEHYGMIPRTIAVGKSEQNGDVEALNGALKRKLNQHLLMRGNREFPSVEAWEGFAQAVCRSANARRQARISEELATMRPLRLDGFPEFDEIRTRVRPESTLVVKRNTYSVPPRLIGEHVQVRIYDNRLEVWHSGKLALELSRLLGKNNHHIDYRHVIDSLLRKPGAFARFRHREDLFPGPVWHDALDILVKASGERKGEVAYLRLLQLAAKNMECEVEVAIGLLLEDGKIPDPEEVKTLMGLEKPTQAPDVDPLKVDLKEFDGLLSGLMEEAV